MLLEIPMITTSMKPIISVNVLANGKSLPVHALIDTGSAKAFWVGTPMAFEKLTTAPIKNNGTASGFGINQQTNCFVSTMNVNLRDGSHGINFRDVPVTHAKVNHGGLFRLILPYTLFNRFEFGFKPEAQNEFGNFYLDTHDNQINYKAVVGTNDTVCSAYVCTDENKSPDYNLSKISVFS